MRVGAKPLEGVPSVYHQTTRGQWLVFVGVVLAMVYSPTNATVQELQARGLAVEGWQMFAVGLAGAAVYVASAWPLWWVLDALPLTPGRRVRHGLLRVLLGVGYVALDAVVTVAFLALAVALLGVDPGVVAAHMQPGEVVVRGTAGFAVLVLAHVVLQRAHERVEREVLARSLARANLRALSLELRPHFLFNALNGIAALVRDDPRRAEKMLVGLGDLLRLTQQAGAEGQVPLRRELEQVDLYLELQAMRFGPRLTVVRDVDPAVLGARVPGMLLQPLVENALAHGIGPRPGPGRLSLGARREGETLVLRVDDDGVGLAPERRERTGVGTTRARLTAMFGEAARFTLAPADGGGTAVELRLPFQPWQAA
ncbi:histidine kinase [Nannocystis sp. SCPEA4]|uniref:sensor histidine kinase n=1 Tax=Nannocystis sp. SCPEA4 TaxID=2996787 RepID=UPI0022717DAD|nr:histidine kinase [Nannocystis sp. SCPEA4]